MHITYDLPVSIDDILEAKQRLREKYIKQACPVRIILAERLWRTFKFENMQHGSFKIAAPLINCAV